MHVTRRLSDVSVSGNGHGPAVPGITAEANTVGVQEDVIPGDGTVALILGLTPIADRMVVLLDIDRLMGGAAPVPAVAPPAATAA